MSSTTWTSTAGSFPEGSTGESVVWEAPSGSGGYATITATLSDLTADDTVAYVYMHVPPNGPGLLRAASDAFSVTVTPDPALVNLLAGPSYPPNCVEAKIVGATAVAVDSLIGLLHPEAVADWATVQVGARLAGVADGVTKWFDRDYHLEKRVCDFAQANVVPRGDALYKIATNAAAGAAEDQVKGSLNRIGFNGLATRYAGDWTRSEVSEYFRLLNPFDGAGGSGDTINEGKEYGWGFSLSAALAGGNIQVFPPEAPDPLEWLGGINEHGFNWGLGTLEGASAKFFLRPEGGSCAAAIVGNVAWGDSHGCVTYTLGVYLFLSCD